MNITDVDDRIINQSIVEKKKAEQIASFFSNAFFEDIQNLKINLATKFPKATDHIKEMITMIQLLESKGLAYNVNGNVFFDVLKFKDYGKLSGKNLDELAIGTRVEINEAKKNPLDFSLWKKAKDGEPFWESPWGKGRPGWHIECSAMSSKYLGNTIDIHAGGNDLIFPHHENEIAQSQSVHEQQFVKYWLHFGFLNINEEKMSKSLGNFFTAREILKKYSAEAIRLFFAQTYYGGPLNFSFDLLSASEKGIEKISNLYEKIEFEVNKNNLTGVIPEFDFENFYLDFEKVMDDDFGTPQAVAVIFDFIRQVNKIIADNSELNVSFFKEAKKFLEKTAGSVLGILKVVNTGNSQVKITDDLIKLLLEVRIKLKSERNFTLSDFIRDELKKIGVEIKDTKEGTTFSIK
jgi:cysteinyl-tRNA synthetase